MAEVTPPPPELRKALVDLALRAGRLDLREHEESDLDRAVAILKPITQDLLARAVTLLSELLDRVEAPRAGPGLRVRGSKGPTTDDDGFLHRVDRWVTSGVAVKIADLCFVGRMELRTRAEGLDAAERSGDLWTFIAACGGCLRSLRKAIAAVEHAMAEHEGVAPTLHFLSEIRLGRQVRWQYAKFRREIESGGPPSDRNLAARLQSAAASVAKLIGRDVYSDFRVGDRAELRSLQGRLRKWLAGEDGFDPDAGRHLWQDLQGFASLLKDINLRSELRQHDQRLVEDVRSELFGPDATGEPRVDELTADHLRRLEGLLGRDDRVDALLGTPPQTAVALWREPLNRLHLELSGQGAEPSPPDRETKTEPAGSAAESEPIEWSSLLSEN